MAISSALGMANAVPVGVVDAFAGSTAPAGWLLCYGQAVSRTQYPVLFSTLSTTYGSGDGSTTFNIPDMRGRAVAGKDDMGGTAASRLTATVLSAANTLGATGGTQTHTLTGAQSGTSAHGHTASSGNDSPDHTHGYQTVYNTSAVMAAGSSYYVYYPTSTSTGGASARHTHTITVVNSTAADASAAHTNTQPTIILNYIIKAQ